MLPVKVRSSAVALLGKLLWLEHKLLSAGLCCSGEHKIHFIPGMIGPFLGVTLVPQPEATRSETKHLSLMGPALCAGVCEVLSSEKFSGLGSSHRNAWTIHTGEPPERKDNILLGVPSE